VKRALVLALVVALPCYAQQADAPVAAPAVVLSAGDVAPMHGLLLSDAAAIDAAKRLAASEAEAKSLRESIKQAPPWWGYVLIGVAALGAGVGLGYGISRAAK
jgi:hypothetical protein